VYTTLHQHLHKHCLCISQPQKYYLNIISLKLDLYTSIYGILCAMSPEIQTEIDSQDYERIIEDKVYASLFLRWSPNMENAIKLAETSLKWRKQNAVRGKFSCLRK